MGCQRTAYGCGIVVVYGRGADAEEVAQALAGETATADYAFASIFFSQSALKPSALAAALKSRVPELRYAGCSSAGIISPGGYDDCDFVVTLFPAGNFVVGATLIEDLSGVAMDEVVCEIADLRRTVEGSEANDGAMFGVLFIDGLSRAEEGVTSALYWSLGDIPLIGGSAGDDLRFEKTTQILDGVVRSNAAVVVLIRSLVPFRVFKTDNFVPTDQKLVVTASDPDARRVLEFNAEPAATAYAGAIGLESRSLGPMSFASHPVVVRVGGEYFCRSIQKLNEDGSLAFFCAVDNGIVLTVAQPKGMVESTREALRTISDTLGGIDVIIGFDCVLRRLDAENRQNIRAVSQLYRENRLIGFGTYGEQYRSMHLNQTLTGIAFGRAAATEPTDSVQA